MNIVAIDFETANRYRTSACSVGIVVADENGIVDEFYSLINPLMDFDSYNTYIHGITEQDVVEAPTFDELWPELADYLSGQLVVAHNASFDMSVLRQTLDRYELPYPELDYLCTVTLSKKVWPELANHKLHTVAAYNNIEFFHHNALEDARAAALLMVKAVNQQEVKDIDLLAAKYQCSKGRIFERGYYPPKTGAKKRKSAKR
ncbi:3'-5' exonuclease [Sediminibacillus albus]|uniref:DNA polymerase-3 subunit epsilon n=1 Tax=Sediminibacillus albus TaxID=407036 RepID=A0A1G8WK55_9BACI|nr:3'-5' exonuclease [Sediminibacillus albus]SDJ78025.1 DNA polymerase-3 subunit epsilon [Sediminibacillus albus]